MCAVSLLNVFLSYHALSELYIKITTIISDAPPTSSHRQYPPPPTISTSENLLNEERRHNVPSMTHANNSRMMSSFSSEHQTDRSSNRHQYRADFDAPPNVANDLAYYPTSNTNNTENFRASMRMSNLETEMEFRNSFKQNHNNHASTNVGTTRFTQHHGNPNHSIPSNIRNTTSSSEFTTTKYVFPSSKDSTPFIVKIPKFPPISLKDVKEYLPKKGHYRFYFKTEDDGEAVFQEENDDNVTVPLWKGTITVQCSDPWPLS